MQLISVARAPKQLDRPPPLLPAVLPLTVQLAQRGRGTEDAVQAAAVAAGGVVADRAVGQRGRAFSIVNEAAAVKICGVRR